MKNPDLKKRILSLSYKYGLAHLGSCLSSVDILDDIYRIKKPNEPFILSAGHCGVALYVILEKYHKLDAETLWLKHGTHPNRDLLDHIYCSSGSLAQGIAVATGYALADRTRDVYCLLGDGELLEGMTWESLIIAKRFKLNNLKVYLNFNHYSAYQVTDDFLVYNLLKQFSPYIYINVYQTSYIDFPFLKGIDAHYHKLTDEEYKQYAT